jgi:hypothetical protein
MGKEHNERPRKRGKVDIHSYTPHLKWNDKDAFQHWRKDNQIYFITARTREGYPAFDPEEAKQIFWRQFESYANKCSFKPIVVSLLNNHYHVLGYLKFGAELGTMMQRIHGSVAKLVNDLLSERRVPFWHDKKHHNYFDGCLRDEKQFVLTYRYILNQAVKAKLVKHPNEYPHTKIYVEHDKALARATELDAFLRNVRYKRYDGPKS